MEYQANYIYFILFYASSEQSCRPTPTKQTTFVTDRDTMRILKNGTEYLKMSTSTHQHPNYIGVTESFVSHSMNLTRT